MAHGFAFLGFTAHLCVTYGAVNHVFPCAGHCAVSCNQVFLHCLTGSVTQRRHFIANIAVAAGGASIGGVAGIVTGRCLYVCCIAVTQRCHFIVNIAVAAGRAGVGSVTGRFTGGCSYIRHIAVTQGIHIVTHVAVVTKDAFIGGEASICTGRSSYACDMLVSLSGDFGVTTADDLLTNSTGDHSIITASGGAGRIHMVLNHRSALGVAKSFTGSFGGFTRIGSIVLSQCITVVALNVVSRRAVAGCCACNLVASQLLGIAVCKLNLYIVDVNVAGCTVSVKQQTQLNDLRGKLGQINKFIHLLHICGHGNVSKTLYIGLSCIFFMNLSQQTACAVVIKGHMQLGMRTCICYGELGSNTTVAVHIGNLEDVDPGVSIIISIGADVTAAGVMGIGILGRNHPTCAQARLKVFVNDRADILSGCTCVGRIVLGQCITVVTLDVV